MHSSPGRGKGGGWWGGGAWWGKEVFVMNPPPDSGQDIDSSAVYSRRLAVDNLLMLQTILQSERLRLY